MDNNTILKLSNKNKLNIKKDDSPKIQVQTQLVDSMTQRINLEENQQPDLIPQSPANSNLNQSKSHNNSNLKSIQNQLKMLLIFNHKFQHHYHNQK